MPHLFKPLDMNKDEDMDKVEVKDVVAIEVMVNTILLIVVVLKVKKNNSNHQKWNNSKTQPEKGIEPQSKHVDENKCHRCGMKGHWSCICRTLKHFVDLYQASIKAKGKEVEINFINSDGLVDLTHLDVSNFFENPNGKIDHLIGDGNVCYD